MKNQKGFTLIELLIVIAIIGIIAAIAIPGLLRARVSANEAAAIGDTRTVISAAHTFASSNCGLFPNAIAQLITPTGNLPNYPATAPTFLDADLASGTKSGYVRTFAGFGTPAIPAGCMNNSTLSFCYNSAPATTLTGVRFFVGPARGGILVGTGTVGTAPACTGPNGDPPTGFNPLSN